MVQHGLLHNSNTLGLTGKTTPSGWQTFAVINPFACMPKDEYSIQHWLFRADNTWFNLLTMNQQPIRFDQEYSKHSEFRIPIVNSTLIIPMIAGMRVSAISQKAIANLGWTDITMPAPVSPVTPSMLKRNVKTKILSRRASKHRSMQGVGSVETSANNQKSEPVMSFYRTLLVPIRGHGADDLIAAGEKQI